VSNLPKIWTGWSRSCGWPGSAPSQKATPCYRRSVLITMHALPTAGESEEPTSAIARRRWRSASMEQFSTTPMAGFRHNRCEFAYRTFDKVRQVSQTAIEHKQLGAAETRPSPIL